MFAKTYSYVGSDEQTVDHGAIDSSWLIKSPQDVQRWITETGQTIGYDSLVAASFVVKKDKRLYLGDRYEEHTVIANGDKVLSAGEISFEINPHIAVASISNLSTSYCPEPKSWKYVEKALNKAGLPHVKQFTNEFIFRKCDQCDTINIVKDDWFVCAVCDAALEKKWNFE